MLPTKLFNEFQKQRIFTSVKYSNFHIKHKFLFIKSYTENARKLLEDSRAGVNPYEGFTPVVPSGERLEAGTPEFDQSESAGKDNIKDLCFVLVAGVYLLLFFFSHSSLVFFLGRGDL